jgi:hypothetical protein
MEYLDPAPSYGDPAPEYAATRRELVHHLYRHEFSKSTLTLDITSLAASPEAIPVYVDDSTINGRVTLDLSGKLGIKEVMVKVSMRGDSPDHEADWYP